MYMCICAFKHLFSHELVLNSNSTSSSVNDSTFRAVAEEGRES